MNAIVARGLLFDLDGVLIDSIPAVERAWGSWAREHGLDPVDTLRRVHGRPSLVTIRELLPGADHEAENRDIERRELADLDGIVAMPGARALIEALPPGRWAIVTSCTRALARARIGAAGLPLPGVLVTASDVERGKPDPLPYRLGAAQLGVPAEACIVIEDAPAGIVAGKAAGATVIALATTHGLAALRAAGADHVVADCSALTVRPGLQADTFTLVR